MLNQLYLNNLILSELKLVHTYTAFQDQYPMKNRGRFHNGLIYTLMGTEIYHFSDRSIETPPGSVLYVPKAASYKIELQGEKSVVLCVDFELGNETTVPFRTDFAETHAIKSCFQDIEMKWRKKDPAYLPECKSCFYKIISMLSMRSSAKQTSKDEEIESAVQYLQDNFQRKDFRLEDLCAFLGISQRYFEKIFLAKYGVTPKAYLILLKIEKAKELLLNEKLLVREIAEMLGYSDCYHFGKLFKERTGYTPSEYKSIYQP